MLRGVHGIHHVAVSVPDLDAAEAFYCGVLGFEMAARYDFDASEQGDRILDLNNAAARSIMIKAGNLYLEVFEFLSPEPQAQNRRPVCDHGYTHIAFEVDDIERAYRALAEAGVRWHCPIQEYKSDEEWYQNAYGRDPFGNVVEVQQINGPCNWAIDELPRWKRASE